VSSLSTKGRWIVDDNGKNVIFSCVNWYGFDQLDYIVGGLEQQPLDEISKLISILGFNCVRLPWSLEMYETNPIITNATKVKSNPQFLNMHALDIMDAVINSLTSQGLMIILDNHVSDAIWCCSDTDGNGLWWNANYSANNWINDWQSIVARYKHNSLVIGADLRNELRTSFITDWLYVPTWGTNDNYTDWHLAATTCGNAIHKVNSDLLIIVEGLNYALDLTEVQNYPIILNIPNKVVYEAHDYSWDYTQSDYATFAQELNSAWGYILSLNESLVAPLWLGEFGTCHESVDCVEGESEWQGIWFTYLVKYLSENAIGWSYWAVDGTQSSAAGRTYDAEEIYGILNMEWDQVKLPQMMNMLSTIMWNKTINL